MTNLLNAESTKKQLNLFEPFFDKELTPDNQYITYIDCNTSNQNIVHSSAVTSDVKKTLVSNNIKSLLLLKTKLLTTREFHKGLKIHGSFGQIKLKKHRKLFNELRGNRQSA